MKGTGGGVQYKSNRLTRTSGLSLTNTLRISLWQTHQMIIYYKSQGEWVKAEHNVTKTMERLTD